MRVAIVSSSMLINVNSSLVNEMISDFEMERQECLSMIRVRGPESMEGERARNRLSVIEASVEELRKQLSDPTRMAKQTQGGYDPQEIKRFYESVDPKDYHKLNESDMPTIDIN